MRDMRDALGALGPVDGQNPELNNLTCSMTFCDSGDVVFITSDGVSDNFDPVVGKFALPKKDEKPSKTSNVNSQQSSTAEKTTQNANNTTTSTNNFNNAVNLPTNRSSSRGNVNVPPDNSASDRKELSSRQRHAQQLTQKQQRRQQLLSNTAHQRPESKQNQQLRGGFRQVSLFLICSFISIYLLKYRPFDIISYIFQCLKNPNFYEKY